MTVRENLDLGCYPRAARREKQTTLGEVLALLPLLEQRLGQLAGTLSGGEQQMLAIGRALMARPRLLMLDEPTLGLAPRMVAQVFETIAAINGRGVTVLLVEQNVRHALKLAHRGYVLENGRVVLEGSGKDLLGDERLKKAYLGL
jgi:branched-chain amino acid transport system ATP-binding protein